METMEAIRARRSIRRFRSDVVPRELLTSVLEAACMAPSAKNLQPWRFFVIEGPMRLQLVAVVREGLRSSRGARSSRADLAATLRAMEEAPIVLLVFMKAVDAPAGRSSRTADLQSMGACLQNLQLAAIDQGLGALWICDILDAYDAVHRFAGQPEELVAAVALGYAAEAPARRSLRPLDSFVRWRK